MKVKKGCSVIFISVAVTACLFVISCNGQMDIRGQEALGQLEANLMKTRGITKERVQEMRRMILSKNVAGLNMTEHGLIRTILDNKKSIFASIEERVMSTCLDDVTRYLGDLEKSFDYAWQMRCSNGNFDGFVDVLYTWKTEYLGVYELCDSVTRDNVYSPLDTKFCTAHIPYIEGLPINKAICASASCSAGDLTLIVNSVFLYLEWYTFLGTYFICIEHDHWEWDAIFVTSLLGLFALVVTLATVYDMLCCKRGTKTCDTNAEEAVEEHGEKETNLEGETNYAVVMENGDHVNNISQSAQQLEMTSQEAIDLDSDTVTESTSEQSASTATTGSINKGRLAQLVTSCSALYNAGRIMDTKTTMESLNCLNGIRVLSMFWIMWGHSNQFLLYTRRLDNAQDLITDVAFKYGYNITLFATFAVDSFFVISGLLVTYLTLRELNLRGGKMGVSNWIKYYVHRIWRLTPTYMISLGIWATLFVHMGDGIGKREAARYEKSLCTESWWANLIYINNLYPYPGFIGNCMGWTWYLANDMQFYIISPFFIVLLYKYKKIGLSVITSVCAASCIVTICLAGYYGLPTGKTSLYYNERMAKLEPYGQSSDVIYGKPWCRIQAYMVGVFVGYLLYRHFHCKKIRPHMVFIVIGWIYATAITYNMVFALHGVNDSNVLPEWFSAVWNGTSRFFFATGVAWIAFACAIGYGGWVNSFLAWSFWTPLARLTFCAYLLHPMIIFLFLWTKKAYFHWTTLEMWYLFLANVVMSYMAALVLSLFVEGPMMGLEKAIFGANRRQAKDNEKQHKDK